MDKIARGFLPASMHFCLCVERQIKNSKPLDPLGVFKTSNPAMLQVTCEKQQRGEIHNLMLYVSRIRST